LLEAMLRDKQLEGGRYGTSWRQRKMSRSLLNIEKRSLLRLMLSGDGLASKDAV
jgi:hypothetical protein